MDLLTVLVAAIVYLIITILWFSPFLFGNLWRKLRGVSGVTNKKWLSYLGTFFTAYVIAFFLALVEFYLAVTSFWDGVIAGFGIWLGFVATTQLLSVMFGKVPFRVYLIENGCYLLGFMMMGGILAG